MSEVLPHKLAQRLFLGIVTSFLLATAVSEWSSRTIDEASLAIAGNAAPSIRHLEAMRTELNSLPLLAALYIHRTEAGQAGSSQELLDAEKRIDTQMSQYFALPQFIGEGALWSQIKSRDAEVERAIAHVCQLVDDHQLQAASEAASGELASAASRQSESVLGLVEFNASQAEALAMKISTTRRRTQMLTLGLDLLCAALAVAAAKVFASAARRHATLVEEHEKLMQERAEELEQFASRVAHDILSPLSPVSLALDMITKGLDESDPRRRWMRHAVAGLDRVQKLVTGLLAFARAGAKAEPGARAQVGEVARGVIEGLSPQASRAGVALFCEVVEPCEAACTPALLGSVMGNLVQNAIKYMGESDVREVWVRAASWADRVQVWVDDTGPGVPSAMREKIFEPHVRAASRGEPGIGLGLATVKKIIQAYGGTVSVAPRPSGGTSFFFDLPAAPPPEVALSSALPAPGPW